MRVERGDHSFQSYKPGEKSPQALRVAIPVDATSAKAIELREETSLTGHLIKQLKQSPLPPTIFRL